MALLKVNEQRAHGVSVENMISACERQVSRSAWGEEGGVTGVGGINEEYLLSCASVTTSREGTGGEGAIKRERKRQN